MVNGPGKVETILTPLVRLICSTLNTLDLKTVPGSHTPKRKEKDWWIQHTRNNRSCHIFIPFHLLSRYYGPLLQKCFPGSSVGKNLPLMQETLVRVLGQEDPLEKGKATHSSILGLHLWLSWLRIRLQSGRPGFDPWVGRIPWRRERLPTPVF